MNNSLKFLLLTCFCSFSILLFGQTGSLTRHYVMHGKDCGNTVTLTFNDGKLQSFIITNNYFNNNDSDVVTIYNSLPQYKWIEPHFTTFVNELKKAETKFVEWDSIARKNKVTEFSKKIEVVGKNDQPLWIKWKCPYKGTTVYSYELAPIFGRQGLGDSNIDVDFFFNVDKNRIFVGNVYYLKGRIYKSTTKGTGFTEEYNNYEYVTRDVKFFFMSPKELQSFIDAADLETAKAEIKKKNEKTKNIDELFK